MNERAVSRRSIFVTDFDGTMTQVDFYRLVVEELLPPDYPNEWAAYREGRLTHFEALQQYFAGIRVPTEDLLRRLATMGLDPELKQIVTRLREVGWDVIVASAGCDWYIRELFARADVQLEVHANPGQYDPATGLIMRLPTESPYFSPQHGIDKAAIVQNALRNSSRVAFAGDGFPDAAAARLVNDELRFARADLANVLQSEGRAFTPFARWSEIADRLLALGD